MVKKYKISVMMFNHWFTKGLEHSGWKVVKGLDENDRLIHIEFDEKIITLWYYLYYKLYLSKNLFRYGRK